MIHKIFKSVTVIVFSFLVFSCDDSNHLFDRRSYAHQRDFATRAHDWIKNPDDKIDPYANMDREDYQDALSDANKSSKVLKGPVVPQIRMPNVTDLLAQPDEEKLVNDKLVSISVNENVPLKDVIIELARRAEVDAEVDKNIDGGIIFIAKNKPFSEVIERITTMAGLTYSFDNGILKVTKDVPLIKNYKFNILDITRSSQSSINTSFTLSSDASGGSGGGGSSGSSGSGSGSSGGSISGGSTSSLSSKSGDGDVWANITAGINQLLAIYGGSGSSNSSSTPAAPAQPTSSASSNGGSGIISVNKNAGVISILASAKQHKAIKEYLDKVHIDLTSQVLIEARVVEVNLNDQYKSGINWNLLTNGSNIADNFNLGGGFGATAATAAATGAAAGLKFSVLPISLGGSKATISSSVELLQTFGTTRSLSNPRISALNNQFAILNFSQNQVYFDVQEDTSTTTGTSSVSTSSVKTDIKTVPVGIVLALQPSIDLQKSEILMNVRPTLTRVRTTVKNPGTQIIAKKAGLDPATLNADIPVIDTRELDTTLRIKNGEIMAIGGLLEEKSENTDSGLPGIQDIPYIGNAFKSVNKNLTNVETVIFIKATIVPGKGVTVEDEEFYKKFTTTRQKFDAN